MRRRATSLIIMITELVAVILFTTVAEFGHISWAGIVSFVVAVLLAARWIRQGNQRWVLYAIILLTFFPETQSSTLAGLELHHVLAAVLALFLVLQWIVLRPWPLPRISRLLVLYYVVTAGLTLINWNALQSSHRLFVSALFVFVAFAIPFVLQKREELYEFFGVLIGGTAVAALIGLGAFYIGSVTDSLFTNPYIHISTVEGVPRIAGTMLDSNFLGNLLLLVVPGLLLWQNPHSKRWVRLCVVGIALVLLAVLWLTYSRSTYIGLGVALATLLAFARPIPWRKAVVTLIASIALATVLVPSFPFYSVYRTPTAVLPEAAKESLLLGFDPRALVNQYIAQIKNDPNLSEEEREQILARDVSSESLGYRIEFWKAGIAMFKDHPLTGVGVGQFRYRFEEYSDLSFIREPDTHNIFIELLAETGIIGITTFVVTLLYAVLVLIKATRREKTRRVAAAVLAALLGITAQSLLLGGLGAVPIYIAVGVAATFSSRKPFSNVLLARVNSKRAKKRVVFITATTKRDGPGNILFYQINGMDREKFEPIVINVLRFSGWNWDTEYKKLSVRRINLGLPKPVDVIAPFILWPLLWLLQPDLVQTQMIRGDVYGRWAAMRTHVPFVSVVHNMDIWKQTRYPFHRFATWFDAQGLAQASHVITVSEAVKRDVHTKQGILSNKITVIRNSIPTERFSKKLSATELNSLRNSLDISSKEKVILTVARAHSQKAPEVWLVAALKVVRKYPDTRFIWVDTGPLFEHMKRMVPSDLKKKIQFIGRRKDVDKLMQLADIFVLPSRFEGMPTVLIEALASGTASIATDVSGNPEVIQHDKTGLLVPSERPDKLAHAISSLISDEARRLKLAKAGQTYALTHFTEKRLSDEYQAFIETLFVKDKQS